MGSASSCCGEQSAETGTLKGMMNHPEEPMTSEASAIASMRANDKHMEAIELVISKTTRVPGRAFLEQELAEAQSRREALARAVAWGKLNDIDADRRVRRALRRESRTKARARLLVAAKGLKWDRLNPATRQRWIHATGWVMARDANPTARFFNGIDRTDQVEMVAAEVAVRLDHESDLWSNIPKGRQVEWRNVARAALKLR